MNDLSDPWMNAMYHGDFEAAWRHTDRLEAPRREAARAGTFCWNDRYLLWDGQPFAGRRVLVRCNHGLGDTLQFARFLPRLREQAAALTVWMQPALLGLFSPDPSFGEVHNGWTDEPPPAHEVEIEIMELAYAFRVIAEGLPPAPYVHVPRVGFRLAPDAFHVGIVWAASNWDSSRSIPLPLLASLSEVPGVQLHSLQQTFAGKLPPNIRPLHLETAEIEACARAMLDLDLIITVDTMIAHLAGALGRPVWLLLKHHSDWRWMHERRDSPWYSSMRIFRQPHPGDWAGVARAVSRELRALADRHNRPAVDQPHLGPASLHHQHAD